MNLNFTAMSQISPDHAKALLAHTWHLNGVLTALPSEWGGTFQVDTDDERYLLKVAPASVPAERTLLEIDITKHLHSGVQMPLPRLVPTISGDDSITTEWGIARLYTWIDGRLWVHVNPHGPVLLERLGMALGNLSLKLNAYKSSQEHFSEFEWSIESPAWKDNIHLLSGDVHNIAKHYLAKLEDAIEKHLPALPHSMLYHDANDHNIVVTANDAIGFIDFGDCHPGPRIQELAVCLAYALMDQQDVLAASRIVVQGFHQMAPLKPAELNILQDLVCVRLVTSLVHAAKRKATDPENAYWQVSSTQAEKLLKTLHGIHPVLMLTYYRSACGMEPAPQNSQLRAWMSKHQNAFAPVLGIPLAEAHVTVFDWSVRSQELGGINALDDLAEQTFRTFRRMTEEGARVGIGRYDEPRPIYTTDEYAVPGLHTPGMRSVHLGTDLIMPAGSPVFAPLDGRVVTLINNAGDKEYGPLVILAHQTDEGQTFYTLYGHNNIYTLSLLRLGQQVKTGEKIAEIGDYPENGNWVPHLHFQIMTDMLGYIDDYPGVADPDARDIWLSLCPDPNLILGIRHPDLKYRYADTAALLKKRKNILGPNLGLSYDTPLHLVRGWKSKLFDEYGRSYLDTVNNIAHVGHEHPAVVGAGQRQMAVLNTNTRYLHPLILQCAQQLKETLPAHLEVIWFVNSGSEANALALRIARTFTGNDQTLVMEEGYHGNTPDCIQVSHYKFKHLTKPGHVQVVPIDLYEENFDENACTSFCEQHIRDALVFIHESLLSCAGQVVPHEDVFMEIYADVKHHGGICIADEVQTGLGRVGSHMWAFERFTIAPDIVTIGKPLGNGHPVAAVACTRVLADRFAQGPEFFSSFGGNPVSCAIASEVLSVIEREDLQAHARELGDIWMDKLKHLQQSNAVIRDVRGAGLFIGIEFSEDKTPAKAKAEYIRQRMLDHRILTSLDGPHGNVMKIKPPMCITSQEVDRFVEVLEKILKEDFVSKKWVKSEKPVKLGFGSDELGVRG